ncbi:C2 calcium-dependent domain-containing protein 4C-like [Seriola lalandi dorsalis]|uniref:C2 calcium-dependent domain-containing protein 4C-like n=1 Tax=Seriola lalandi dorsalis TaxID=1841481 RepID=UPI000C6F5B80|nr:C2 calcium-dependent domain-containing protein 4C-like [Seriola lalandi dorsalis]XP_056256333.1 C2 calcium-dependent domain-containing protein 4C-like [Seriola aureovittata]XP_056256334.1 C2 calcium-dependent domain-containing protein 4C-like [Seriola aureovittata]
MSAVKSGSSLRSLLLTPERIPHFLIPSRSPLLTLSPRPYRRSLDRTRLLSDHDEDSPGGSPPEVPLSPAASPRFLLRLPPRIKAPRRAAAAEDANADTDLTTRAAMSLPHVEKVTTPYGFRAVLAASPCTHRRESMFHRNKPVTVAVTDNELQDPGLRDPSDPPPLPSRSRICLPPIKALGLQVMRELKRPAASLKALSPRARKTR